MPGSGFLPAEFPTTAQSVWIRGAVWQHGEMPISWFRGGAAVVWVAGIAGMIASSINGNNNGWVVSFGCMTALAALCLFSATAAIRRDRIDVFEEADAERLEDQVQALVTAGADETAIRDLVRDAMRLGRRKGPARG